MVLRTLLYGHVLCGGVTIFQRLPTADKAIVAVPAQYPASDSVLGDGIESPRHVLYWVTLFVRSLARVTTKPGDIYSNDLIRRPAENITKPRFVF